MTWLSACGWTLLRSVLLTLLAWPVSATLAEQLRNVPGPRRSPALALLLLPFLFPELVTGYAYAPWVAGLPWPAEGLCSLLLWLRIIPVGAVTLLIAPPAGVSASGWHLRNLLRGTGRNLGSPVRWFWVRSIGRSIPALGLMWFVLFQEFELAALLKTVSWADWLFVAQVGGLPLSTSWRLAMLPLLCELAVLLPIIVLVTRSAGGWSREIPSPPRLSVRWLCRGYLVVAILLVCVVPVGLLLRTSWSAWRPPRAAAAMVRPGAGTGWRCGSRHLRRRTGVVAGGPDSSSIRLVFRLAVADSRLLRFAGGRTDPRQPVPARGIARRV